MENDTQEKEEDVVEPADDSTDDSTDDSADDSAPAEDPKKAGKKTGTSAEKRTVPAYTAGWDKKLEASDETNQKIEDYIAQQQQAKMDRLAATTASDSGGPGQPAAAPGKETSGGSAAEMAADLAADLAGDAAKGQAGSSDSGSTKAMDKAVEEFLAAVAKRESSGDAGVRNSARRAKKDAMKKFVNDLSFKKHHPELFDDLKDAKEAYDAAKEAEAKTNQRRLMGKETPESKAAEKKTAKGVRAAVTYREEINKKVEYAMEDWGKKKKIKEALLKVAANKGIKLTKENINKIKSILLESKSKNMFNIVNETERDMAETLGYLNEFLPFSKEKMNYDRPVKIRFVSDQTNAGDVLGKTAHYNPSIDEIAVYVDERHPKDIMRSISHELVHHSQNCRGEFDGTTTLGEQPYMQTSEHLNEMERQAYEVGNMTFRIWEDNYKHTQRENKKMSINEETVRAAVKEALMKRIKEVVVREPGDTSPLTPEEIKLFLAASGHTGVEVAPPGVSGIDVEEVLPPGVTAADVAEMAPEEEEELEEYQDPCAELGRGIMDPATGECVEDQPVDESTDREWYRNTLNESLIKRFIK